MFTQLAGHNRISTQALTSTAQAVAAEVFGIAPQQIRASWSDDRGMLALALALPISVPALTRVLREPGLVAGFGGSVWERARNAKPVILERVSALSGSRLSRVDIRLTTAQVREGGRVR